jgi:hypothetical protein
MHLLECKDAGAPIYLYCLIFIQAKNYFINFLKYSYYPELIFVPKLSLNFPNLNKKNSKISFLFIL